MGEGMKIRLSVATIWTIISLVGCDNGDAPSSNSTQITSFGKVTAGSVTWRGSGYEYARSMVTYINDTNYTFKTIQIQCVAKDAGGAPVSDFLINHSVHLGELPLSPDATRTEEAAFRNGSQVKNISCSIKRAQLWSG